MVQLSDDCFATDARPMTVEAAVALMRARLPNTVGCEVVALNRAGGRIAAEDLHARNDLPPFANSAVDGYAVRHADLAGADDTVLPVGGRLAAGAAASVSAAGRAVRIFTGAAMPPDADSVFMQEDVVVEGGSVRLPAGLARGANMRAAGEDVVRQSVVVAKGRRLRPQDLALAAATGHRSILVRRAVRACVLSTGDELVKPGSRLGPGAIYDSNRIMLGVLLSRLGIEVCDFGIAPDEPRTLRDRLRQAAETNDVILSSGGVSVGEEDHVKAAVEAAGQLAFWRLAIKPGRSLAMGRVGDAMFVGLPGNPVAAYVTFAFVVRPLLAHLAGAAPQPPRPWQVRSAFAARKRAGRREYIRVSLAQAGDGVFEARRFPREGAALLTSLTTTDGLAELADDATQVAVGDMISFHPYEALV